MTPSEMGYKRGEAVVITEKSDTGRTAYVAILTADLNTTNPLFTHSGKNETKHVCQCAFDTRKRS